MSRRQYIDQTYLTSYLGSQTLSSDFPTKDALIEMAEEMIDGYVGPQRKWFQLDGSFVAGVYSPPDYQPETPVVKELRGRINTVVSLGVYTLEQWQQNAYQNGFFSKCNIDIIGGTGAGTSALISASTLAGQITITNLDGTTYNGTPLDNTSEYRIYQLGKFPRDRDVFYDTLHTPTQYYKMVPEQVREATAAQAEYINKMGLAFFTSDAAFLQREKIGPYEYSRDMTAAGPDFLIAPKAKLLLRGFKNRRGVMVI